VAAITKTPSNTWKAIIRKRGWPTTIKTFRTKRDAEDWARSTEDEMVRGVYINRAGAEKLLLEKALDRYLSEVSSSKRESTAYAESHKAKALKAKFGAYSLAAITKAENIFRMALRNRVRPFDTDLIFFGEPGRDKIRRPYEFRPAWHRTLKDAGIKGLRFHDLRHEAVSRLVEAGLGDQEVAAISGHKSMQMLKRYTHLRAEDLVARLDQVMG
jgi:site-specific recombinase XerD